MPKNTISTTTTTPTSHGGSKTMTTPPGNSTMSSVTQAASSASSTLPTALSDQNLYDLCQQYGTRALLWRRKFIGLLPEVNRREQISRKQTAREGGKSWLGRRGFSSIFEFAAKLAGISEEQVRHTLNLERQFADKPVLHESLVEGKISINKLIKIASVVTIENQEWWSTKAATLSTRALETLVRDQKTLPGELHVQPVPQQSQISASIELRPETTARLRELQARGFNIDQLINDLLDRREQEIAQEKAKITAQIEATLQSNSATTIRIPSRYIPANIRKILRQEYGTNCSIPHCHHPAATIHHTRRFSLTPSHDPRYLAPLCHEHHQIAHSIDMNFLKYRVSPQVPVQADG